MYLVPHENANLQVQALICRYTRAKWTRTWFITLRYNLLECTRKTRGGLRRPIFSYIRGETAHIPPIGPEVNSDNGLPIVNENSGTRWNQSARCPIVNDIPHRRTYRYESAETSTSSVMDDFSQGATVGGQSKQDRFSSRDKRISLLPNDLPRRRTFHFESIKDGDLVVHDVPPPSDAHNAQRRRTYDVESLINRQGYLEQDGNGCKSQDGEDPIPYTDEELAARARGTRWGFHRSVEPIAEEHPRRAVGYRQDLGQILQGRSTTDPVVFNPRKETSNMQRHRWNEPRTDDVPRRRQYNSTLDDTRSVQVDVQGSKRGFLQLKETFPNVHQEKPHSLRNVDSERESAASGAKILLPKVWRKGKPVMSDIPRRHSMQWIGDAKWTADGAPTKHVENNNDDDDDNDGAQDGLHVRHEICKGNIVSHDVPRRRSFRLDGAEIRRKAYTLTSSSGMSVDDTHGDRKQNVEVAPPGVASIPLSPYADDISASRGMESHRSFNAQTTVQSTAVEQSHRIPGGRRGFDGTDNFQNKLRLKRTPLISDIPRRRSTQSAEEARCSARIAVTSCDADRSTDPDFEESVTQQEVEGKHFTQDGVLGSRCKLNTPARFPTDLPHLNVGHQKGQLGAKEAKERDTDHHRD